MRKAKGRAIAAFTKAVTGRANVVGFAKGRIKMNRPVPITSGDAAKPKMPLSSTSPYRPLATAVAIGKASKSRTAVLAAATRTEISAARKTIAGMSNNPAAPEITTDAKGSSKKTVAATIQKTSIVGAPPSQRRKARSRPVPKPSPRENFSATKAVAAVRASCRADNRAARPRSEIVGKSLIDCQFDCCSPWSSAQGEGNGEAGQADGEDYRQNPGQGPFEHGHLDQSNHGPAIAAQLCSQAKPFGRNFLPGLQHKARGQGQVEKHMRQYDPMQAVDAYGRQAEYTKDVRDPPRPAKNLQQTQNCNYDRQDEGRAQKRN